VQKSRSNFSKGRGKTKGAHGSLAGRVLLDKGEFSSLFLFPSTRNVDTLEMQRIVHSASAFLDYFDSPSPSGNAHFNSQSIKPLLLPARPDFAEVLSQQGCSIATVSTLSQMMETSGVQIEQTHRAALKSAMRELAGQFGSAEAAEFRKWETAVGDGIVRRYMRAIEQLQETVIQEIQAAKSRYSTSSPSPSTPSILSHPRLAQEASTEAAGNFTEEVVGILHKAFETKATLTRAEVKSLSAVTHLNTKQVSLHSYSAVVEDDS